MITADTDIDIDLADRSVLLEKIPHVSAAIHDGNSIRRHNSGIYVTEIPVDARTGLANIDYRQAERRGYFKLDLLNMSLYKLVRDHEHLESLMREPNWCLLEDHKVVERLVHIHDHWDVLRQMPEPVNSIPRLAMFLAIIRPAKRKLVGKPWAEVAKTIWEPDPLGRYTFKRSHSVAYSHLVAISMNLLTEHYNNTGNYDMFDAYSDEK